MDATPRLRSAFPSTPHHNRRAPPPRFGGSPGGSRPSKPIPDVASLKPSDAAPSSRDPVIPETILDAPTQRLFAVSVWTLLQAWKFYDFVTLEEAEEQSLWLFMKWLAVDGTFLFGLPGLRIPWLEWSSTIMMLLFCAHALVDGFLMFRIPIPLGLGLAALGRSLWGAYELAVNEHNVNPETIKFNDSLILGRQIIHILPEGSAVLNPDHESFCIDSTKTDSKLPIMINSTNPIAMELLRIDLESEANETIHIGRSQIKAMHRDASRLMSYSENPNEPKTLYYSVRKTGLYVLQKVIDETNLEVARKQLSHTSVVSCPRAQLLPSTENRCKGELSDINLEVVGTPPLKVKYFRIVNKITQDATLESIMPEDFSSPLTRRDPSSLASLNRLESSWSRPQTVRVPLIESLVIPGRWEYYIQEVEDGFGNTVSFSTRDHEDQARRSSKPSPLHHTIAVHERPTVSFHGCSPQRPMKVPQGKEAQLPLWHGSTGKGQRTRIDVIFAPEESGPDSTESTALQRPFVLTDPEHQKVKDAGFYTISGVSTEFCRGEVLEPASCLLQNPPRPQLSINKEEIFDKCAGSSIGLRVDLDLIGTPPFDVLYDISKDNIHLRTESVPVSSLRRQLKLEPREAGHYRYKFKEVSDAVYKGQKLQGILLDQDVKPSASASFSRATDMKSICIDESADFQVYLQGERPYSIEYELIYGGKRSKRILEDINESSVVLSTGALREGGDYTLALTSITDRMGCKEFLKQEVKINVRHQKPKVAFGQIEGRRNVETLEGQKVELPLRLSGDAPWLLTFAETSGRESTILVEKANDGLIASHQGTYKLTDLRDVSCPGVVDDTADTFQTSWIPRPEIRAAPSTVMEWQDNTLVRQDICEGDEDALEILFKGLPQFQAQYVQSVKLSHGTAPEKNKEIRSNVNVGSLRMESGQAGLYKYRFTKLEDGNYKHSPQHFSPLTIQQRVNERPSVAFANPGKTYGFCSVESDGEEVVPITLHGQPPFNLEVEIKHHGSTRPETVSLTGINSHKHNIRIPHSRLHLGKSSVALRRVSDSRGCARSLDYTTPKIQLSVHDAPTITALESQSDFCVGDRINFALSGAAPFNVFYTFEGAARKAVVSTSTFRRLAEKPGEFVITGVQDSASQCRSATNITKHIYGMPSARVSKGRETYVDIHEGGTAEILFEFGGVPPFEFSYTRSSNTEKGGKKAGTILDMRSEVSEGYSLRMEASEEGTYEVVAIKDRYCAYAKPGVKLDWKEVQKKLKY